MLALRVAIKLRGGARAGLTISHPWCLIGGIRVITRVPSSSGHWKDSESTHTAQHLVYSCYHYDGDHDRAVVFTVYPNICAQFTST